MYYYTPKKWWKYAPTVLTLIKRRCAHSRIVVYLPTTAEFYLHTYTHRQSVYTYMQLKDSPRCSAAAAAVACARERALQTTNVQFGLTSCANFYNDHFLVLLFCSHNISLFFFMSLMSFLLVLQQFWLKYIPKVYYKRPLFCLDRVKLGH